MNNKYQVLFITHYNGMYGANQSLCKLMVELRKNYNICPIVLLPSRGPICEFLEDNDIKYYIFHFYWWVNADTGFFQALLNIRKQFLNILRLPKLLQILKNNEINLVYSNSITINIGFYLSKILHRPHIWHIRESMDAYKFKYSMGVFFSKFFFQTGADRYIVISDFLIKTYAGILPSSKIQKVYNGVSIKVNEKVNRIHVVDTLNICCIGVMCEQKNQLEILEALNILKEEGKTNIRLHLIGSSKKDYLQEVNDYINRNKLEEMVCIYGHQSNVNDILDTMDIGVVAAHDEAFGRASIEYMLHKMPVIASQSGANQEIVKDGVNGYLYSLYNPKQLANKVKLFLKDPFHTKIIGAVAFRYAQQKFSSEQNAREVNNIMLDLLKK